MKACEDSLRRLQVEHIDLYQLHRPSFELPIDETMSALTDLVRQGKVRYVGCSTTPAWKVMEAIMVSELKGYVRFVSEQPPYNLLDRRIENEMIPLCREYHMGLLSWSPLAMGILAGRYDDASATPADSRASLRGGIYAERITAGGIEVGSRFVQLARAHGFSPAQLAVLWVKAPLIGPRTLEQLEHFLPVLDMQLNEEIRVACDALVPPGSAVANFHNSAPWMKMQIS
jgi:aryl-alcohol dehydrogenase-like predicted oxidoreductase